MPYVQNPVSSCQPAKVRVIANAPAHPVPNAIEPNTNASQAAVYVVANTSWSTKKRMGFLAGHRTRPVSHHTPTPSSAGAIA
jgi:hypothetical protein